MWPKEYIHVARQRAGAFRFKHRASPKMAAVGDAPHQDHSQESCSPTLPARGWHGLSPPIPQPAQDGSLGNWGCSSNLCNCPPKQQSQGATLAPPRTPRPAPATEAAHSGSGRQSSDRPPVQTAGPELPVTPWPAFWWGVSVALGARQDRSTGPVSPTAPK